MLNYIKNPWECLDHFNKKHIKKIQISQVEDLLFILLNVSVLDRITATPLEYHSHAIGSPMTGQLESSVNPSTHENANLEVELPLARQDVSRSVGRFSLGVWVWVRVRWSFLFWSVLWSFLAGGVLWLIY